MWWLFIMHHERRVAQRASGENCLYVDRLRNGRVEDAPQRVERVSNLSSLTMSSAEPSGSKSRAAQRPSSSKVISTYIFVFH